MGQLVMRIESQKSQAFLLFTIIKFISRARTNNQKTNLTINNNKDVIFSYTPCTQLVALDKSDKVPLP